MKRFFTVIMFLSLFIPIKVFSLDEYVYDEAELLSRETIDYIIETSNFLDREVDVSFYTMTISHLDEYDIDTYTDIVFDANDLGKRGVLILFDNGTKAIRILTGEELSYYIPPDYLDNIINDYFVPYLSNREYDKGLRNGYSALFKGICEIFGIDSSSIEVSDGNDFVTKYKTIILVVALSIALFITYFFCIFFRSFYHTRKHTLTDYLMFGIVLFSNIVLVCYAYTLEPASVVVYSAIVLYVVMRIFGEDNNISIQEALFRAREKEK